jgi:hypothetical protein
VIAFFPGFAWTILEGLAIMDASDATDDSLPPGLRAAARDVLRYMRIASPIVLLVVFTISFIVSSIISARRLTPNRNVISSGPGGRPLPKRTRSTMTVARDRPDVSPNFKLLFKWLSVGVLLTFIADAAINMGHVLYSRSEHWWNGQAVVVSTQQSPR